MREGKEKEMGTEGRNKLVQAGGRGGDIRDDTVR